MSSLVELLWQCQNYWSQDLFCALIFFGFIYYSVFTSLTLLIVVYAFLQLIYRPDNGEILGVHIFGLHAADLINEASNAIALGTHIQVSFSTTFMCAPGI